MRAKGRKRASRQSRLCRFAHGVRRSQGQAVRIDGSRPKE